MPSFNTALLQGATWRGAIEAGGWVSLALVPLILLIVREPRRRAATSASGPSVPVKDLGAVVRDADFRLLAVVATSTVFAVLALATNLALFSSRLPTGSAASGPLLLFCLFGSAVTAQLLSGLATYRVPAGTIHRGAVLLMLAGSLAFALGAPALSIGAIIVFGAGWGANSCMLQIRPTLLFAGPLLGRALSLLALAETIGGGFGPVVAGLVVDHLHDFRAAFLLVSFALVIPLTLSIVSRR